MLEKDFSVLQGMTLAGWKGVAKESILSIWPWHLHKLYKVSYEAATLSYRRTAENYWHKWTPELFSEPCGRKPLPTCWL